MENRIYQFEKNLHLDVELFVEEDEFQRRTDKRVDPGVCGKSGELCNALVVIDCDSFEKKPTQK